jgi:hypothetical protein
VKFDATPYLISNNRAPVSPQLGPDGGKMDRIKKCRGGDEKAVELFDCESDVRDILRNADLADQSPIGIVGMNAIAGARPYPALAVYSKAIEQT